MKLGPMEIVIILVIVLMVFGVGKLPQIASSIGQSLKSFREGQQGIGNDEDEAKSPRKRKKASRRTVASATAEDISETPKAGAHEEATVVTVKRKKAGRKAGIAGKAPEVKPESENITAG
jgi:sec-independent protein translocase protein TatA